MIAASFSSLNETWASLPLYVKAYLAVLFVWLLFAAVYFPVTDSDALASYVARFEYARFGPIEAVATLSIQYTFPQTFDWIVWVLARTGHLAGLPAFLCFLVLAGVALADVRPKQRTWLLALLLSSPVMIAQAVSQKNDIALAVAFAGALTLMRYRSGPFVLPALLFICAFLIGTKWLGVPLAGIIMFSYLAALAKRSQTLHGASFLCTAALSPLFFMVASAETYIQNIIKYGSPIPVLPDMQAAHHDSLFAPLTAFGNLLKNGFTSAVDVFRLPILLFQHVSGFDLFNVLDACQCYLFKDPFVTSHAPLGYAFIPMVIACAFGLALPSFRKTYGIQVAAALIYGLLIIFKLDVSGGTGRYLMPVYAALLAPTAVLLSRIRARHFVVSGAVILAIYISAGAVMFSADRTPLHVIGPKYPFTAYLDDPSQLMFLGAPALIYFYASFKKKVMPHDNLVLVDNSNQDDVNASEQPYFYPFLLARSPANTRLIVLRKSKRPEEMMRFTYVMVYSRRAKEPRLPGYTKVLSTTFPCLSLYKRKE